MTAVRYQVARRDELMPRDDYDSASAPGVAQTQGYVDFVANSLHVGIVRSVIRAGHDEVFVELAARWRTETLDMSSTHDMVLHPAYQQIIGLGLPAVPLLLRELRDRPDPWFFALSAITREDPTVGVDTFDAAVEAWLVWGREQGLI